MSEKEQCLEVVGHLVDMPDEPELGHWFEEEAEEGEQICRHQPLVRQADAERVIDGLRYKAELYDEVWERATGMGFMNVTMGLAEVDQLRAEVEALRGACQAVLQHDEAPIDSPAASAMRYAIAMRLVRTAMAAKEGV